MARRRAPENKQTALPDMTSMMDLAFNIISFFVMITTLAKDEAAQKVRLPAATSAPILKDDQLPDSLSLNVASLDVNGVKRPVLLNWGLQLDLTAEASWTQLEKLLRNNADILKDKQRQRGIDPKKLGLTTTMIVRIDGDADYALFRRIMDLCRKSGFTKFQFKAKEFEDGPASK